jgi:hypothetical protein
MGLWEFGISSPKTRRIDVGEAFPVEIACPSDQENSEFGKEFGCFLCTITVNQTDSWKKSALPLLLPRTSLLKPPGKKL